MNLRLQATSELLVKKMIGTNFVVHLLYELLLFSTLFYWTLAPNPPNIVIIIADDMGFDDVSFRGSNEFLTPNIDALAYSGIILKNFYASSMCTPSRAALLTGKYPIHTGMQHYVIVNDQPWGLPLNEITMAEIFKQNGYHTNLLGKWHLGMSRQKYTPTFRGFDEHFGYLGAYVDYYDHTLYSPYDTFARGHDFRKNLNVSREHIGTYVTDLLTQEAIHLIGKHKFDKQPIFMVFSHLAPHSANEESPLQAPIDEIHKFSYIRDERRRIYAAMMSILDKSVGQVIDALYQRGVLNETILVFFSDNGGPTLGQHSTTASNYPLRGQKNSPWEGALRSSAVLWSSQLESPGTVWTQKMYIADLLPTLASAAGIPNDRMQHDGIDMWNAILSASDRSIFQREIVHNIDEIFNYVSYTNGKLKFINGTTLNGVYDHWLGARPSPDSDQNDPRAQTYDHLIRSTLVWQQLQQLNDASSPEQTKIVNITHLREEAAVKCDPMLFNASPCEPLKAPCLFDIDADPCEMKNLYGDPRYKKTLENMLSRIAYHRQNAHKPNNKPKDPQCDPRFYDNEWTWWEDMKHWNYL